MCSPLRGFHQLRFFLKSPILLLHYTRLGRDSWKTSRLKPRTSDRVFLFIGVRELDIGFQSVLWDLCWILLMSKDMPLVGFVQLL